MAENLSSIDTDPIKGRMREDITIKQKKNQTDPVKKSLNLHVIPRQSFMVSISTA